MTRGMWRLMAVAMCAMPQGLVASVDGPMVLAVDAAASRVLIEVGKTGMLGFAGHAHEVVAADVHGRVTFDPADPQHATVRLEFAATALRVSGKGEPAADVVEVQKVMQSERVLDVARFPAIVFASRRVALTAGATGPAALIIDGDMTLHGVTRPMTIRARVLLDGAGRMAARGSFVLKQSDFGMVPVTAVGGTIQVRDDLDIQFVLTTRPSDVTDPLR
jgi:polyisoprenoid-binding protein YceI